MPNAHRPRAPQLRRTVRHEVTKTVLILDWCGEQPIEYAVLHGDYTKLDRLYINMVGNDRDLEDQLSALLFNENGQSKLTTYKIFPYRAMGPNTAVIVAGCLP